MELIFVIIVLIFGLMSLFFINRKPGMSKNKKALNEEIIQNELEKIRNAVLSKDARIIRGAVLSADKLIDHILKSKGYQGETMAERVKAAQNEFGILYNAFWDAHKSRNRIAHEVENEVRYNEALDALIKLQSIIQKIR